MSEEINITVAVLEQWLKAHEASPEPIGGGRMAVKSTDDIRHDLSDIVERESNDVANLMLQRGYSLHFLDTGRHGWAIHVPR